MPDMNLVINEAVALGEMVQEYLRTFAPGPQPGTVSRHVALALAAFLCDACGLLPDRPTMCDISERMRSGQRIAAMRN